MPLDRVVKADESAIGSTLTRDVKDDKGAVVCFAGDKLSASLLLKLKRAGISSVRVERESESDGGRGVDERLSRTNNKFARVEMDTVMRGLKEIIAKRMKEKAGDGT